jgi:hypothetical protein
LLRNIHWPLAVSRDRFASPLAGAPADPRDRINPDPPDLVTPDPAFAGRWQ